MRNKNFATLTMSLVITFFCCFLLVNGNDHENKYDEEAGKAYLKKINADIQVKTTESVLASWAYESNITDENLRHQLDVSAKLANFTKEIWKETIKYPWKTFKDPDVRRQFIKFSVLGTAILSPPKYNRFNKIISDMQSVYGKAKICSYHNRSDCSLQLEPELTEIFVKSRDPDELRYYWEEWRKAAGKPVREMYKEYVDLSNEAAVLNNFTDNSEFWLKDYEAKDFKEQVEALWQQLRPLYLQLHAFVRRRLREQYGEKYVTQRGPIPAHLLGNMWAQSWGNVFDFTVPYPGKPSMDVTPSMVEQGYTPLRMFKLAEEFFTSLNLSPMPETFWKNSILAKPDDGRDLICHASAWDFYDGKDFRIKQCTRITMEDLNIVHHEMGHIQYFLQYKNQPLVYKEGTNPGFHEAVGDVMALSVSTPKHLRKVGLLNETEDDTESDINQLYNMALEKIAFLPFGYLMDQWRWSVFEGKTTEKNYNCKWWQLREKYQGLSPSVVRTEDDFDPGAKYHTVGNVPYIRYFVSFVIQFQFHRSLCIAAKEFDPNDPASKPLHKCDIYQSKKAGALLKEMLQLGSSKPWPYAMEVMTGQRKMDASALLEYFATLQAWLEKENKRTGEFIGWESSQRECTEEQDKVSGKSSDTQGNFEDDNISYSYAEFVRQDDNSFGFPDYLEEVQPSYQVLRHRPKKSEFQANYFLRKRNARLFPKSKNFYLPDIQFMRDRNKYVPVLQDFNSRLHSTPALSNGRGFQKRVSDAEIKLLDVILKKIQYINDIKDGKIFPKEPYGRISRRDVEKEDKNTSTEETIKETNEEDKKKIAAESELKEESKLMAEKTPEAKESVKEEEKTSEAKEDTRVDSVELEGEQGIKAVKDEAASEGSLESDSKFMSKSTELFKPPEDLMWKAELIKNEAERMLHNFNLSAYSSNVSYFDKLLFDTESSFRGANAYNTLSNHKKARNTLPLYQSPEYINPEENTKVSFNLFEDALKNLRYNSLGNNGLTKRHLHFKKYDLVGIIPVDNLLVEHENEQESTGRKSHLPGNSELTYVMLVGKLSEKRSTDSGIGKRKQKKSYKAYNYSLKTPVVYNTVVINSGGKTERTDDGKESISAAGKRMAALTERRRNFVEEGGRKRVRKSVLRKRQSRWTLSKNSFSSSVKNNIFNKNNIVQYVGRLQLLL